MRPVFWGAALVSLAALLLLAIPAFGQTVSCGDTRAMLEMFDREYGEKEKARGVALNGILIRLLVGPETWTLLATLPEGVSCPVFAGTAWEAVQGGSL